MLPPSSLQWITALELFLTSFHPADVYLGALSIKEYLESAHRGFKQAHCPRRDAACSSSPTRILRLSPYKELFDDSRTSREETPYIQIISCLDEFFAHSRRSGLFGQTLLDLLLAPMRAAPHSLYDQLEYIRTPLGHLSCRSLPQDPGRPRPHQGGNQGPLPWAGTRTCPFLRPEGPRRP